MKVNPLNDVALHILSLKFEVFLLYQQSLLS